MSNLKKTIDRYIQVKSAKRNNQYASDYEALGIIMTQQSNAALEAEIIGHYFNEFQEAIVSDKDNQVKEFAINDLRRHAWFCACEMIELAIACETYKKGTEK